MMNIAPGVLPAGRPVETVVRVNCVVNTVVPEVNVYSNSHTLRITKSFARLGNHSPLPHRLCYPHYLSCHINCCMLIDVIATPPEGRSVDFNLSYSLLSPDIIGTLIKEVIIHFTSL
jgi:hypothetical protein